MNEVYESVKTFLKSKLKKILFWVIIVVLPLYILTYSYFDPFNWPLSLTLDKNDNIYITTQQSRIIDLIKTIRLVKYDSSGRIIWQTNNKVSPDFVIGHGFVIDGQGELYQLAWDDSTYLLRFDKNGRLEWVKPLKVHEVFGLIPLKSGVRVIASPQKGRLSLMTVDSRGTVAIEKPLLTAPSIDSWLVAFDHRSNILFNVGQTLVQAAPNGDILWRAPSEQEQSSITVDRGNNIYLAGNLRVEKYTSDGKLAWRFHYFNKEKKVTASDIQMAVGPEQQIYVSGGVNDCKKERSKIFIKRLNAHGRTLWTRSWNTDFSAPNVSNLTIDSKGCAIINGHCKRNGHYSVFIVKYDANGNKLWEHDD